MAAPGSRPHCEPPDYYQLLGLESTASEVAIKNAYRRLAIRLHPDKNPGDPDAAERFKAVSVAYAVLSDPSRRHQYDRRRRLGVGAGAFPDFEGVNMDEIGGLGRLFGALFSSLGVPIPTQIAPRVLAQARQLAVSPGAADAAPETLVPGQLAEGRVERQCGKFYWLSVNTDAAARGVLLLAGSAAASKFKLILFDREGGVRMIEESVKAPVGAGSRGGGGGGTRAHMYLVPFDRMRLSELFPLRFLQDDREVPLAFYRLHALEPACGLALSPGRHLVCLYGDNWLQDARFSLTALVAEPPDCPAAVAFREAEAQLKAKKAELDGFRGEYLAAKRQFEAACARLEADSKEVERLVGEREAGYRAYIEAARAGHGGAGATADAPAAGRGSLLRDLFNF